MSNPFSNINSNSNPFKTIQNPFKNYNSSDLEFISNNPFNTNETSNSSINPFNNTSSTSNIFNSFNNNQILNSNIFSNQNNNPFINSNSYSSINNNFANNNITNLKKYFLIINILTQTSNNIINTDNKNFKELVYEKINKKTTIGDILCSKANIFYFC